jgi:hypothetical protein
MLLILFFFFPGLNLPKNAHIFIIIIIITKKRCLGRQTRKCLIFFLGINVLRIL